MSIESYSTSPSANRTQRLSVSKTLSANNTTANVQLFRVTGSVRFLKLYGVVTTVIGANHTGSYFRLNDQTAQVNITSSTVPTALSAAAVGTHIGKTALLATIANVQTSAAGRVLEPGTAEVVVSSEFDVIAKNGANTDIEYTYSTTDAPTSGVIEFFVEFQPLSSTGGVTTL